ncbi:MAG: RES family NAD+ phosphorylase [Methylobacterium mesophilicum]|nr:RES family NAD+ phosphorylase [Methylobacterium mesophilicum]
MRLWRLSATNYAESFDGGYGLVFNGRWNLVGRPVTYAATVPSLCVLEKLVHVEDPGLLPDLTTVAYEMPDDIPRHRIEQSGLPADWQRQEALTQGLGDDWLRSAGAALLFVPSAILAIDGAPDCNVLINHRHPASAGITIAGAEPFALDVRLFGR